jgi:hypothetical protein
MRAQLLRRLDHHHGWRLDRGFGWRLGAWCRRHLGGCGFRIRSPTGDPCKLLLRKHPCP